MICPYCQCPMELTDENEIEVRLFEENEVVEETILEQWWVCPECEYQMDTYDA